jgi:DNA-binding response OmpR family regulator
MSGFEVLRNLRVSKVKAPILILMGLDTVEDKVRGLGFGADDYIIKLFHRNELVARIHAIVRRSRGHAESVIRTGNVESRMQRLSTSLSVRFARNSPRPQVAMNSSRHSGHADTRSANRSRERLTHR